jgi:hypothetical protein
MKADEFETRLKKLSDKVGKPESIDPFSQEYSSLLIDIKAQTDPRYTIAWRLRRLLDQQAQYLLNEWIRLNRNQEMI